ncbi:MAG: ethanolamine ammonia-lyase subunit EutC [Tepidanaerobacter acetatoxydans]|uniref:ethanolamine ammonia-lyase subunit EutC n=1 Tax=Tepidanaerobacter TaxID=499228 RepID=UPI000AE7C5DC|nr:MULTISPECIES: ethanolamine ammonia-lyase subunit EutC [Tepidanaerobacter]NLU11121.1 ethanolamine ammonia-lyase subunit EutC [Tepidanaerobacter acetatoxydans]
MISEKDIRELVESVIKELNLKETKECLDVSNPEPTKAVEDSDNGEMLPDLGLRDLTTWTEIPNPQDPEGLARLKSTSPARIGIWRAGTRFKVNPWLRFKMDVAAAKDAVLKEVDPELIEKLGLFTVQTVVKDKDEYLTRPDLGRKLSEEAKEKILQECPKSPDVQFVVCDGLSSRAIEANAMDFIPAFEAAIKNYGLKMGKPFFVKYARVAVMDEIGELLNPEVLVELIGERPGLVTAKSMSAYMCYKPNKNTIESDRTLVSNIHDGGLPPIEAGAHVASIVKKIFDAKASGLKLNK